jgi:hypothetical protein
VRARTHASAQSGSSAAETDSDDQLSDADADAGADADAALALPLTRALSQRARLFVSDPGGPQPSDAPASAAGCGPPGSETVAAKRHKELSEFTTSVLQENEVLP